MLDLEPGELNNLSTDEVVKKYMEEITRVNEDPEFREYMSAEEDNKKIENSLKAEWLEKGIEQGIKQGINQGIEKGIEQGNREASLKIAKELLERGTSIEDISNITGLDLKELQNLKNNNLQ